MEEAAARRERLKALKAAAQLAGADGGGGGGDAPMADAGAAAEAGQQQQQEQEPEKPTLKFRNYAMKDARIEHEAVAPAPVPKVEEPAVAQRPEDADEQVCVRVYILVCCECVCM